MPTFTYGPVTGNAIQIIEQEASYSMTEAQLEQELADLKASHNSFSDETLYQGCLEMLEGALRALKGEQSHA